MQFKTTTLPVNVDEIAPDGSNVRLLLRTENASVAHFELEHGQISRAVQHPRLSEIWYFLGGRGRLWRRNARTEEIITVQAGVCITIPPATDFQFRNDHTEPLTAFGVTMPPWPNDPDACLIVNGIWSPTERDSLKER